MSRALKRKTKLKTTLIDLLNSTEHFRRQSSELNTLWNKVKEANKGTPQWVWWYLQGYYDGRVDRWYRYHLEFVYVLDGIPHSTHDDSCLPRLPAMAIPKGTISGHCWKVTAIDLDRVGGNLRELPIHWWFHSTTD